MKTQCSPLVPVALVAMVGFLGSQADAGQAQQIDERRTYQVLRLWCRAPLSITYGPALLLHFAAANVTAGPGGGNLQASGTCAFEERTLSVTEPRALELFQFASYGDAASISVSSLERRAYIGTLFLVPDVFYNTRALIEFYITPGGTPQYFATTGSYRVVPQALAP